MVTTSASRAVLILGALAFLVLLVGLDLASEDASAGTYIVPDPSASIQDAIDTAFPGETVLVKKGTYTERIDVNKAITIRGDPLGETIIWATTGPVVSLSKGAVLRELTILGSMDATGVWVGGDDCRLVDVKVRDCKYGVYIDIATSISNFEMERCRVTRCQKDGLNIVGAAGNHFEHLTLTDSLFESNAGSGIYIYRVRYVEMDNVSASKNQDWGIYAYKVAWVGLSNSTLRTNDVGLYLYDSHGWTVEDTEASNNRYDGIEVNQSGDEIKNIFRRLQLTSNSRKYGANCAGIAFIGRGASESQVEECLIKGNPFGVRFNASVGCNLNTFHMNEFRNCIYAIWEGVGTGPNFYTMNNFIDNEHQAYWLNERSEFDYGGMGNFWSDYLIQQPRAIRDGVLWNSPYNVLNGFGVFDMYPLAFPYEEDPPVLDLGVDRNVSFAHTETIIVQVADRSAIEDHSWKITAPGGHVTSYNTLEPTITFIFRRLGTFWIEVTVTDVWGSSSIDSVQYLVIDDVPPVAIAGKDITVDLGKSVTLDGTGSRDNNGIAKLTWVVDPDGLDLTFTESIVTLDIDTLGAYTATLFIVDYSGNSAFDDLIITIQDLTPPRAEIRGDMTVSLGEERTYDGRESYDRVGIVDWLWTVSRSGVQNTYSAPSIKISFDELGTYTIVLRVTDAAGQADHAQITVRCVDTEIPVARAGADVEVFMGTEVLFDASGSTDNVKINVYSWSLYYQGWSHKLNGKTASWGFDDPGTYQVTLTVTDTAGNSANDWLIVTVRDSEPPVAKFWSPEEGVLGDSIVLDASGSEDNLGITEYEWTINHKGEVETLTGVMVTVPVETAGSYKVTLTVRDAAGNAHTEEASIYVPPKSTEAERPAWLLPVMVLAVVGAALVSWFVIRRMSYKVE